MGLLRYNLFWDNTPFCTLLFINRNYHRKGYGALGKGYESTRIWHATDIYSS
ncbi:hypothetical protein [Amedibacillus dolichus]|uniref:hypothetical protein n=1 Tax=Amedibacillus dolichus TaxID=31971 RepID=UPI003C6C2460